jgi:hypothetical protein
MREKIGTGSERVRKYEVRKAWEHDLDKIFEKKKENEMSEFLSVLSMIICDRFDESISALYNTVENLDMFTKIINTFAEMTVRFPSREQFKDAILISLSYYYKEIKNLTWQEIREQIPDEDNISMYAGKGIFRLNKKIKDALDDFMCEDEKDEEENEFSAIL